MSNKILQLDPPIPLDTTRGKGLAHFLVDYGSEHHWLWVVFMDDTGECWTFENTQIRAQHNPTFGRVLTHKYVSTPPKKEKPQSKHHV